MTYNILILSDIDSWIAPYVAVLRNKLVKMGHNVHIEENFPSGSNFDMCFMLSYSRIVSREILAKKQAQSGGARKCIAPRKRLVAYDLADFRGKEYCSHNFI